MFREVSQADIFYPENTEFGEPIRKRIK